MNCCVSVLHCTLHICIWAPGVFVPPAGLQFSDEEEHMYY